MSRSSPRALRRRAVLSPLLALALLAAVAASAQVRGELPSYHPEDPEAKAVTADSLPERDGFWPYQVQLTEAWTPEGAEGAISEGVLGVLIRVETSGRARIDFGRDGLHEVPPAKTDLLERANHVRLGELDKVAPNFVHAVGPRLVDSRGSRARAYPFEEAFGPRAFLAVFADPGAEGFEALAKRLALLREVEGLQTILFPQGEHAAADVHDRLVALEWRVPFVHDNLSEAYTRSLRSMERPLPEVMLQTPDGRVLHRSAGESASAERTVEALRTALGAYLGEGDGGAAKTASSAASGDPGESGSP